MTLRDVFRDIAGRHMARILEHHAGAALSALAVALVLAGILAAGTSLRRKNP